MLVACRLAGLSALEAYYAGVDAHAQMLDRPARAERERPDRGEARQLGIGGGYRCATMAVQGGVRSSRPQGATTVARRSRGQP